MEPTRLGHKPTDMDEQPDRPSKRSTKREVNERVTAFYKLTLKGAEFSILRQFAAKKGWDLSDRQIRRYQRMAMDRFAKFRDRNSSLLPDRQIMRKGLLFRMAVKAKDVLAALAVEKDLQKLLDLYPKKQPPLPPLEMILGLLPPQLAADLREAIAEQIRQPNGGQLEPQEP
jgi:hypothetical protein